MCKAKVIAKKTDAKSIFECNRCGNYFEGYNCYIKTGQNKFCSRKCAAEHPRNIYGKKLSEFNQYEKLRCLKRDAEVIEFHVTHPGATLRFIADRFKTHEQTVAKALGSYYARGRDFVLIIGSDIDSERAIELSESIVLL